MALGRLHSLTSERKLVCHATLSRCMFMSNPAPPPLLQLALSSSLRPRPWRHTGGGAAGCDIAPSDSWASASMARKVFVRNEHS